MFRKWGVRVANICIQHLVLVGTTTTVESIQPLIGPVESRHYSEMVSISNQKHTQSMYAAHIGSMRSYFRGGLISEVVFTWGSTVISNHLELSPRHKPTHTCTKYSPLDGHWLGAGLHDSFSILAVTPLAIPDTPTKIISWVHLWAYMEETVIEWKCSSIPT